MKKFIQFSGIVILIVMFSTEIFCETYQDRMTVNFVDSSKPGLLRINGSGDITVEGYNGKEVIIRTESEIENLMSPPEDEKAKGLRRISGSKFHVSTIEDENSIVINRGYDKKINIFVQVPFNTSLILGSGNIRTVDLTGLRISEKKELEEKEKELKDQTEDLKDQTEELKEKEKELEKYQGEYGEYFSGIAKSIIVPVATGLFGFGSVLEGDIEVKNISGEIEINAVEGNVTLVDITGGVAVNSVEGNLLVNFKDLEMKESMYFSTVEGDIDVTLPSDLKANLVLRTVDGEMYTDFDIEISRYVEKDKEDKKSKVTIGTSTGFNTVFNNMSFGWGGISNTVSGKINGGGPVINMTTVEGNIYMRKGK